MTDSEVPNDNPVPSDKEMSDEESDAGSDIFMPGGITVKPAEISDGKNSDLSDTENQNSDVASVNVSQSSSNDSQATSQNSPEIGTTVSKRTNFHLQVESDDDNDSNSGCLEINTDTPDQDGSNDISHETIENDCLEDRNIFSNSDLFLENNDEKNEHEDQAGKSKTR